MGRDGFEAVWEEWDEGERGGRAREEGAAPAGRGLNGGRADEEEPLSPWPWLARTRGAEPSHAGRTALGSTC